MKTLKTLVAVAAALFLGFAAKADDTKDAYFAMFSPESPKVTLDPGNPETFCVAASSSEYDASKCEWWLKQDGGKDEDTPLTPIPESNGLACEFGTSDEGTYYIIFQLSDLSPLNEYGDTQIAWMVTVGEGGGGGGVTVRVAGDPVSYEEGGANLSLGDGDTQVIKATVTISSETEVDYVWGCSSMSASVTVNPTDPTECTYRHAASTGNEWVYLDVYPKGNTENWLGGASWCIESKPAIGSIFVSLLCGNKSIAKMLCFFKHESLSDSQNINCFP